MYLLFEEDNRNSACLRYIVSYKLLTKYNTPATNNKKVPCLANK
jgi:hypothetical protein